MKLKMHSLKSIWKYMRRKMVNETGSVDYIARGWALGMFVGCTVPIGGQLIISIPLSFILKGSKIGAVLGTLLTNPVTVIFIYPAQCWIGERIISGGMGSDLGALSSQLQNLVTNPTWKSLAALSGHLVAAFLAGGLLMAIILTPITYYMVRSTVVKMRRLREKMRVRREKLRESGE